MDKIAFGAQIDRIKSNFGKKNFLNERVQLIYDRFKDTESSLFKQGCDWLILNKTKVPLIGDFVHAVAIARENQKSREKRILAGQSISLSRAENKDDVKFVLGGIMKRLNGLTEDREWYDFMIKVKQKYSPDLIWCSVSGKYVSNDEAPEDLKWLVRGENPIPSKGGLSTLSETSSDTPRKGPPSLEKTKKEEGFSDTDAKLVQGFFHGVEVEDVSK